MFPKTTAPAPNRSTHPFGNIGGGPWGSGSCALFLTLKTLFFPIFSWWTVVEVSLLCQED